MAIAEMDDGDLLAAFGDTREEALENLEDILPRDKRVSSMQVGSSDSMRQKVRELAAEIDEREAEE